MKRKIILLILFFALWGQSLSFSQTGKNKRPKSFDKSFDQEKLKDLPKLLLKFKSNDSLRQEAKQKEKDCDCGRKYVSNGKVVNISLKEKAKITETFDNGKLWLYAIKSKNALALKVLINNFRIPHGATLFAFNADKSVSYGPFTGGADSGSKFSIPMMPGEEIILEYYEPDNAEFTGSINIYAVFHHHSGVTAYHYDPLFGPNNHDGGGWADDPSLCEEHIGSACAPFSSAWTTQRKSVVLTYAYQILNGNLMGEGFWCSGSLLNNTSQDGKPYLYTAEHCLLAQNPNGTTDPEYWEILFNFESMNCSTEIVWIPSDNTIYGLEFGASPQINQAHSVIAWGTNADYLLLKLSSRPQRSFNAAYSGWDKVFDTCSSCSTVAIHHPKGSLKKISADYQPPGTWSSNTEYWQTSFDYGRIDRGSSGGPLFESTNKRVIGNISQGNNTDSCKSDSVYSGKFSWPMNNDVDFKNALDPNNTNANTTDALECPEYFHKIIDYNTIGGLNSGGYYQLNWANVAPSYTGPVDRIEVKAGCELLISGKILNMAEPGSIFVEAGAKLTITNSVLQMYDYSCPIGLLSNTWEGITVEGVGNSNGSHGLVEISNSYLYDAITAVYSDRGGIVKINASTFENCKTSVQLDDFCLTSHNGAYLNESYIDNSTFYMVSLKPGESNFREYNFIKLKNSCGLEIGSNNFFNISPMSVPTGPNIIPTRGTGISSHNSSYGLRRSGSYVTDYETGCRTYSNSNSTNWFKGLSYGIHFNPEYQAGNCGWPTQNFDICPEGTLLIAEANFEGNHTAVQINRGVFHTIAKSTFSYDRGNSYFTNDNIKFISTTIAKGFLFTENMMTSNNDGTVYTHTDGSDIHDSKIYLNKYYYTGNTPVTYDVIGELLENDNSGLNIWCNEYHDLNYAWYVDGTLNTQGSTNRVAGNLFDSILSVEIYKNNTGTIRYYEDMNDPDQSPDNSVGIVRTQVSNSYNCNELECHEWPNQDITVTGIQNLEQSSTQLNIWPNPANKLLNVSYRLINDVQNAELYIIDMFGRQILYRKLQTAEATIAIDSNNLPAGIYFLKIISNTGLQHTKKVVIQK